MRGFLPVILSKSVLAGATALAMIFLPAPPAQCQNEVLNELYGGAVHAYNSGNYRRAYNNLTMAARSGSRDPRVYYYRGLTYLRLGRPQEARADFNKAAALEMSDSDRFYPVSKSLERIQGTARQQIERARANARLVAYRSRERGWYERYHRIRKNEPNVLALPDNAEQLPAPKKPAPPVKKPADEPPADEMPADEMPADDAPAEEMPADEKPAEKPADDPFGDNAGDDEKKPADEMPADEMPAEKEGDDKPAKEPAADDPFGDNAGDDEKKPAAEMPADKEAEAADAEEMKDEDAGAKPADEKPADEKKGEGEKKAEDDDPFST